MWRASLAGQRSECRSAGTTNRFQAISAHPASFAYWGICLTQVARVLWSDVGRAPSPAAGAAPARLGGGRRRPPPRAGAPPQKSRCQSDYLSQADTPLLRIASLSGAPMSSPTGRNSARKPACPEARTSPADLARPWRLVERVGKLGKHTPGNGGMAA